MNIKQKIGKKGEEVVAYYLQKNFYEIRGKNFSCRQGEIDLIAWDKKVNELVFIEVKTRTNDNYGQPSEAVNSEKKRHIFSAIEYYLYNKKIRDKIRIDVVEVYAKKGEYLIHHIKQAF